MRTPLTSRALNRRMSGAGLSRRGGRGGGPRAASASLPSDISGLFANWRADSGVTVGTGASAWLDRTGAHTLVQATGANQPSILASVTELNSQAGLRFDGSNDNLVSNEAASVWKFRHDGSGVDEYVIGVSRASTNALRFWVSTATIATADTGASLGNWGPATNLAGLYVVDGDAATRTVTSEPATGGTIQDLATAYAYSYLEGAATEFTHRRNGATLNSGASISAPTANNPTYTLTVGSSGAGANFGHVDICEIIIYNKVLSAAERSVISAYCTARYGVAA